LIDAQSRDRPSQRLGAEWHARAASDETPMPFCEAADDAQMPFHGSALEFARLRTPLFCIFAGEVRCPIGILKLIERPDSHFAKNR
jgi:hypothetical protein